MPRFVPALAAAAMVLVVGVVAVGVYLNGAGVGVEPSPTPSASPAAGLSRFTSTIHGITLDYPSDWHVRAATEPFAFGPAPTFDAPNVDVIFDPTLQDQLYFALVSWPLVVTPTSDGCCSALLQATPSCSDAGGPWWIDYTLDGSDHGFIRGCHDEDGALRNTVAVAKDGRAYIIELHVGRAAPQETYDASWFRGMLDGVALFAPDASATSMPSAVPSDVPSPSPAADLPAGAYLMDPGQEHGEDQVTVTIPGPGWFAGPFTASLTKELGNENRVTLVVVSGDHYKVPRDICDWQTSPDLAGDRIADTLNDLVAFFIEQTYETPEGSVGREFSSPVDLTIDGYPGKSMTSVIPLRGDRNSCDRDPSSDGEFSQQRVFCSLQDRDSWACQLAHLEPGALDKLWIVDADQSWFRVIAASYPPTTSPDLLAEMNAIVESAVFPK